MLVFDIKDLHKGAGLVGKEVERRLKDGLLSAAMRMVSRAIEITGAEDPAPIDRGIYRAGFQFQKTPQGADVYNATPHAPIIEDGARATNIKIGRKMIEALAEWVLRKGLVATHEMTAGGRSRKVPTATREAEANSIAWAIAKNMEKVGIFNRDGGKGLGIMRRVLGEAPAIVAKEVAAEFGRP